MKQSEITKLVDNYVDLDAKIKTLTEQRDAIKLEIVALGEGSHGGHKGAVSVALQVRRLFKQEKAKQYLTETQFENCFESGAPSIVVRVTRFDKVVNHPRLKSGACEDPQAKRVQRDKTVD